MKILLKILFFIFLAQVVSAQKKFEGEIDYKMLGFDASKKDTITGDPYKILFGKNAIKIQRFTTKGVLFQEQIIFIDSLKEIFINHSDKTYWEIWKFNPSTKLPYPSPWGFNKSEITNKIQKIEGYETDVVRLVDTKEPRYGHADLNRSKRLFYPLPPQISKNLFVEGLLFFEDNIMLGMKLVQGVAPYFQEAYLATKVELREVNPSEFAIPKDYTATIKKKQVFN